MPKHFSLFKALFLSKSSFGQLKCKFGSYAAIFSTKLKNVLGQGPSIYRKDISFSKKCSSSKERFFGNVKCGFDTPHENFRPKTLKVLAVSPNVMPKNIDVWKIIFLFQNDPQGSLKAVLTNALNCFCQKTEIDKKVNQSTGKVSDKAPLVT